MDLSLILLMNKTLITLRIIAFSLFISVNALAQTAAPQQKMSVDERMAKARAAKAEKKVSQNSAQGDNSAGTSMKDQKATPADYKASVDRKQKGPNGEVIYMGERGGKYYINKNGNKTYLSSNQ